MYNSFLVERVEGFDIPWLCFHVTQDIFSVIKLARSPGINRVKLSLTDRNLSNILNSE